MKYAFLILLFLVTPASGQNLDRLSPRSKYPIRLRSVTVAPKAASPDRVLASVRIGADGGCSGTIIKIHGKHAWGISAAHCAGRLNSEFTIGNPDGTETAARWIAIDKSVDLALFITWSADVMASAKVSEHVPDFSKRIEAVGYPSGNGPKWKRFRFVSTDSINRGMRRTVYRNDGPGRFGSGDSGGGVFYDGDHLIGVMSHGGPRASTPGQVVAFLRANAGRFKGVSPFS